MRNRLLLAAILVVAVGLRFTGLGWGLRHLPHIDERFFVENTAKMLAAGDGNHRFYEYPALFSYFLGAVLSFLPAPQTTPDAYYAARAVNASFGVLSVLLTYLLGRRLAGEEAGLFAAALLAVSPAEVLTAHVVRPDVALHPFMVLALLAFTRIGPALRGELLSGAAVGLATAIKFSAPLIAPAYLARRLAAPGFRWSRPLIAAAASILVFAVCSPYTFVNSRSTFGMWKQVSYHYQDRPGALDYDEAVLAYGEILAATLGYVGLGLAAAGIAVRRKAWREWIALLVLAVIFIAVFSTATVREKRFLIPTLGAVCVLAGFAVQHAFRWRPLAGVALAVAGLAAPALASAEYVRAISAPITKDLAGDWIEAHYPNGARVLMSYDKDVGLDRSRFEVTHINRPKAGLGLLVGERDFVIVGQSADRGLTRKMKQLAVFKPKTRYSGSGLFVLEPTDEQRPRYDEVPLGSVRLSASSGAQALQALAAGGAASVWRAEPALGAWIEIEFPKPVVLGRIEIAPATPAEWPPSLDVLVAGPDAEELRRAPVVLGRPRVEEQVGPVSDVLVLDTVPARRVRLVEVGRMSGPWSVASLKLGTLPR